ncbi:MAG: hypothetical protein HYZ37_08780 [Candidatus Solibacter usitatus]|nr:hypothetical protein [Candidatus Solibacter usitatus]
MRVALFWAPRALLFAFSGFLSLFAIDVFGENLGLWQTLLALLMHLLPSLVLLLTLVLAWKWEWVGAGVTAALGILFLWWNYTVRHNAASAVLMIAGPLFLISGLYLNNWIQRVRGGRS